MADSLRKDEHVPVRFADGSLKVGDEVFISNIPSAYTARLGKGGHGLVFGVAIPKSVYHADLVLGKVHAKHLLADARNKLWWMTPEWGTSVSQLPTEIQFLLAETGRGIYVMMCPLIDQEKFRATLQPAYTCECKNPDDLKQPPITDPESLCVHISSGNRTVKASEWGAVLLVAAGTNPYKLIDDTVIQAAAMSGGAKPRTEKVLPDSVDTFGWCTWDAFYCSVSAQGVEAGVKSLYEGGVPPKFVIIDDGWQRTDVDPHLRVVHDTHSDTEAQRAERRELLRMSETYTGPHRPLHLQGDDTGRPSNFLWERPPWEGKRAGRSLARHIMEQRAAPVIMVSPNPWAQRRHLRSAEQLLGEHKPPTTIDDAWKTATGGAAAAAPAGRPAGAAAGCAVAAGGAAGGIVNEQEHRHDLGRTISVLFGGVHAQPPDAASQTPSPAVSPATPGSMDASHLPSIPEASAEALSEGGDAAAEPEKAGPDYSSIREILQAAAGAAEHEDLSLHAAAEAAAAEAAAGPPSRKVHYNRPGIFDGLLHTGLIKAFSMLPKEWQPTVGAAVGYVEGQAVRLLYYLLRDAKTDSSLVKFLASPYGGPLRDLLLRFYAATDDFSKRLTCPTANAKFGFVGATAAEGLRPDCHASAIATVAGDAAGAGAGADLECRECDVDLGEMGSDMAAAVIAGAGGRLLDVVSALRKRYGVARFYCWHAMLGYWSGISCGDPSFRGLKPTIVHPFVSPRLMELEGAEIGWGQQTLAGVGVTANPAGLYELLHGYLEAAGIDGVKVDVQSVCGLVGSGCGLPDQSLAGGPALANAYQTALEASVARHFPGNHLINCMCHSTENLYRMSGTVIARASDDFFPRNPASHTTHVGVCAYNTLFLSPIVLPDWDMFQSRHSAALMHAVARVISGGPVYVSDKPEHHDFSLLKRLVLPDGSVLRPLLPGRPTRDCLFKDPMRDGNTLLKVWNQTRFAGLLAVFNVQGASWDRRRRSFHTHDPHPPTLDTFVRPNDIEDVAEPLSEVINAAGAQPSGTYALFSDRECSLTVVDEAGGMAIELPAKACDIITAAPLLHLQLPAAAVPHRDALSRTTSLARSRTSIPGGMPSPPSPMGRGAYSPMASAASPMRSQSISLGMLAQQSPLRGPAAGAAFERVEFGVIGMLGMFNPSGAILRYAVVPSSGHVAHTMLPPLLDDTSPLVTRAGPEAGRLAGARVELIVKGHGPLLLHSSRRPKAAMLDGEPAEVIYDGLDGSVVLQVPAWRSSLNHEISVEL